MDMFDLVFNAMTAMNQVMWMLAGLVLLGIGVACFAWFVYSRRTGTKVKGRIVAIRATGVGEQNVPEPVAAEKPQEKATWSGFFSAWKKEPGTGTLALFVAFLMLGIPFVFIGFGAWKASDYLYLRSIAETAPGKIVDIDSQSGDDGTTYYAIASFKDTAGNEHRVRDSFGKGGSPVFKRGENVTVLYDPANPDKAYFGSFLHNTFLPLIFTGMGTLVLYLMFFAKNKTGSKGRAGKKPGHTGEMYAAVYEYKNRTGETVRAEDGSSANWIGRNAPGAEVVLYASADDPQTVTRPGFLSLFFGLCFAGPGVGLLYMALTQYEFNVFTPVMALGFLGLGAFKVKKIIKPRSEWDTKKSFQSRRKAEKLAKRAEGRLLTVQEVRERVRYQDRQAALWTPVVVLLGAGLIAGGFWLSRDMRAFTAIAVEAPGEVVRIESRYDSSSDGGGYTYYPVVAFSTGEGSRMEFQDSVGSNPSLYGTGDMVTVLYDTTDPEDAIIDRGIWNWSASGGCMATGALLLLWSLRVYGGIRSRKIRF